MLAVEQMTVKLIDRDEEISRLRQQSTDTVSQLEKTHMTELLALKDERDHLQRQINEFRSARSATHTPHFTARRAVYATACPSVRPSVYLCVCSSVRPSHSGIVSKRGNAEGCGLYRRVAQCL